MSALSSALIKENQCRALLFVIISSSVVKEDHLNMPKFEQLFPKCDGRKERACELVPLPTT